MARLVNSTVENDYRVGNTNIPVYGYCIEGDNYEEAYALAKQLFERDISRHMEELERHTTNREETFEEWFTRMNNR